MGTTVNISTEKNRLNNDLIHCFLSQKSYWAMGRSKELVLKSIANSLCFGVYNESNDQIAFARVVTDYVVFAWVMDVFVIESHRGKGIAKQLINHIVSIPELSQVNGFGLRTNDAHSLYEKFGFGEIPDSETWMFKKNN
ncbi:GNAT family N-acetyltransferase [uncultured Croceitalea sp.]|uniref:GNAT family N-acetyltransferase n=1 Tax=uncultured Croceitalea sp. TaxID=1798908 RepID=UPI00330674F6